MSENKGKLLSVKEVAERLGVHPRLVSNLIRDGDLVGYHIGKGFKVYESDLDDYIERRRVVPKQPEE